MKNIYLQIIKSYSKIPFVNNISDDILESKSEETLSNMITNTVVPGVITFYGHSMSENRNYLDVIKEIINNLQKSKDHFDEFKKILNDISEKQNKKKI